jgi:hypothetical protein
MGSNAAVNGSPDDFDPPMDLQWHGSHAPSELEKLLDICGLVYCLHLDGTDSIETIAQGTAPTIPAAQLIASADCGNLDFRGKTVVVSSLPSPVIVTETITGPNDNTWEFVVQDWDKVWRSIEAKPDCFEDNDPVDLIQKQFSQLSTPNKTLESQLYHCIRLNTAKYPPALTPILAQRFDTTGGGDEDETGDSDLSDNASADQPPTVGKPQILANVAVLPKDISKMPENGTMVDCNVQLKSEGTILTSDVRLGKMSGSPKTRDDYDALFTELVDGDLSVRISHEKLDANFQPVYYVAVFTGDGSGGITQSSSGDGGSDEDHLKAPDASTLFVPRPDFLLFEIDGSAWNQSSLDTRAKTLAGDFLIDASAQTTMTRAAGFVPSDLSGLVSKIEITQRRPQTTFYLNHWWRPSHRHFRNWHSRLRKMHGTGSESYPQQHQQHPKRTALGMSGATQPNIPHGSPADQPENYQVCLGKVSQDGGTDGTLSSAATFTYTLKDLSGKVIGTKLTPTKARSPIGSVLAGNSYALYAWANGSAVLLDALEQDNTGPCQTGGS